jgi:YD repeat-containing protein
MHYLRNGQWQESREVIESYPGGAIAREGQIKALFARNLATAGAIDMELSDGRRLRSHPLLLAYYDHASQRSVRLAEVKDSIGVVDGNQVFYEDALTDVRGIFRYVYAKSGVSQDLLLLEQLDPPEVFGLDSRTTTLQLWTEWLVTEPVTLREERVTWPDGTQAAGHEVDFGALKLGPGKAFRWGADERSAAVPVLKSWRQVEGRDFLIEEVPVADIAEELDRLPPRTGATPPPGGNAIPRTASLRLELPPAPRTAQAHTPDAPAMLLARYTPPARAFTLDYEGQIGPSNFTFRADTTYCITNRVNLYGTTVFEGGSVLKFVDLSGGDLWVYGAMQWDTGPFRPTIFTSVNDDLLGEVLPANTGVPQRQQHAALITTQSGTVRGARFLYARTALCPFAALEVEDVQFVDCGNAIDAWSQPVTVRNGLFTLIDNAVVAGVTGFHVTGEHWTGDRVTTLVSLKSGMTLAALNLTNCLFTAGTNWVTGTNSPTINTNGVVWQSSNSGIYQTAGAGRYYLADGSSYRNAGATNLSSSARALIQPRTTCPPLVFSNVTFTADTNLTPRAVRDTNTPDLGYHYAPLDYVFGGCHTTNANITVTAGTALGWFRTSEGWYHAGQGIHLGDNTTMRFDGTLSDPAWWVRFNTVQEGGVNTWSGGYGPGGITSWAWPNFLQAPRLTARFLRCSALANDSLHIRDDWGWLIAELRDCEFYGGGVAGYNSLLQLTNCLLYRSSVWVSHGRTDGDLALRNCTFYGGTFSINRLLDPYDPPLGHAKISVRDCAFDRVYVTTADQMATNAAYTDYGWNAYETNISGTTPAGTSDRTSVSFDWQTGTLGNFYLPPDSVLKDAASITNAALAGFYHYTILTNNVKEATSPLDIGYHHVACSANGVPVDTDGDGLSDFLEDSNGNGITDEGESPWWLLGIISQPQNQNLVQGQNAPFTVVAGGATPFAYQWRFNGANVTGASSSAYTNLVVTVEDEGNYSVVVTNTSGSITSSFAALTVHVPLAITNSPTSRTVLQGSNVSFSVGISGNYPVYQWYTNGVKLYNSSRVSGATGSTLTVTNVTVSDAVNYTVVVTNLFGSVTSAAASLTVLTSPVISSWPTNTTAIQSDDVTFNVNATGSSLCYQWWLTNLLGTNSLLGATNKAYSKLVVRTNDAGHYAVNVTNLAGSTNASADLSVLVPPWITQQPANVLTNQGSNATFSVTAMGTTNLIYQWFKNGTNSITGATNSGLTLSNVQPGDAAGYSLLVTNTAGTNFSAWAWLSVRLTGGGTNNGWGGGGSGPTNQPRVFMIGPTNSSPTNPAVYQYGPPISIRASATNQYSYITNVAFYYTGTNYGTNFLLAGTAVPGANTKFALAWTNALPGTNILKARAWDCSGKSNDSALVYVLMDRAPSVSNAPANISLVWEGYNTNVWFTNYVSDDGLPYGTTNLSWTLPSGVTTSNTYSYTATNITIVTKATFTNSGLYALRLDVSDGFLSNSASCYVTIKRRPQVNFNSPTNNATYIAGTPLVLNASAYDLDGTIANVSFYCVTNLGMGVRSMNNTYTFAWFNAPVGTNLVSAVATDNDGLMSTSTVSVVILPRLAVHFVSPTNGQVFAYSPTNILLAAFPTSYIGSAVSSVVFSNQTQSVFLGTGTLASNSTYQTLWLFVTNGNYSVTVTARDALGNPASNSVSINVNALPLVSIITPTNIQSFTEVTNITLVARAYDAEDGTNVQVRFYYTNSLIGSGTNIPGTNLFRFVWPNRNANYYPVVAVASDTHGASSASELALFKGNATNTPPFVQIISPTNGMILSAWSDLTILANANDSSGISQVDFFAGTNFLGRDTTGSITQNSTNFEITVRGLKPGVYDLRALAKDAANPSAQTVSSNVTITVQAATGYTAEGFWDPAFGYIATNAYADIPHGSSVAFAQDGKLYFGGRGGNSASWRKLVERLGCSWTIPQTDLRGVGSVNAMLSHGENFYCGVSAPIGSGNDTSHYIIIAGAFGYAELGDGLYVVADANPCGTGSFNGVQALQVMHGDLYIGGDFTGTALYPAEGKNTNIQYVAKLAGSGTNWSPVGASRLNGSVLAIADLEDTLYVGGSFTSAGTNTDVRYLARLVNGDWQPVGAGVNGKVRSLKAHNGLLFVGGEFNSAGSLTDANCIACWDGKQWSTINNGVSDGTPGYAYDCYPTNCVTAIAARGNDIYVTGSFTKTWNGDQSVAVNYVAHAAWSEVEHIWQWSALNEGIRNLDGAPFGRSITIHDLTNGSGYEVIVAGSFTHAGDNYSPMAARWVVGLSECSTNSSASVTINSPASLSSIRVDTEFTLTATVDAVPGIEIGWLDIFLDEDCSTSLTGQTSSNNNTFTWLGSISSPGLHKFTARGEFTPSSSVPYKVFSPPIYLQFTNLTDTVHASNDVYTVLVNDAATNLYVLANDQTSTNDLRITHAWQLQGQAGLIRVSADQKSVIYLPSGDAYGTDRFFYSLSNGQGSGTAQVTVNLRSKPIVQITNPSAGSRLSTNTSNAISGTSHDWDGSVSNVTLFINDAPHKSLTPASSGIFTTNWTTNATGFYTLFAVATDNDGLPNSSSRIIIVLTNSTPSQHSPMALITNLAPTVFSGRLVSSTNLPIIRDGVFQLRGRAYDLDIGDAVAYQVLVYRPEDWESAGDLADLVGMEFEPYADVTLGPLNPQGFHIGGDTNGDLGTLDLTGIPNGVYDLVLRVRGGTDETNAIVRIQLESELKIGQFSFGEQDLVLPVNGIPLTVTRTYKSLNPLAGAFGQSWTFALNDMDVVIDEERAVVNALDTLDDSADLPAVAPFDFSLRTGGGRDVTLTLPDGRRTTFYFTLVSSVFGDGSGWAYDAKWIAPPGVTATLTTENPTTPAGGYGDNTLFVPWTSLKPFWRAAGGFPPMDAYDFPTLVLSNRDGTKYVITREAQGTPPQPYYIYVDAANYFGNAYQPYTIQPHPGKPRVSKIIQRSGDTIEISPNNVLHKNPTQDVTRVVLFDRDGAGRITAIRDPNAGTNGLAAVKYVYNRDTGNLIQVQRLVDRAAGAYQTVKYRYDHPRFPHYITSIEDPRGIPITRNEYDDSGRLVAVLDASGNRTQFIHNATNRTEVVVDPLNRTNTFAYDSRGNVKATTNALNQVTLMTYDDYNNKTNEIVYLNSQPLCHELLSFRYKPERLGLLGQSVGLYQRVYLRQLWQPAD